MSAAPQPVPVVTSGVTSRVLLVVADSAVSQAAVDRTAELAGGAPVTVVGIDAELAMCSAAPEPLRRSVALAMSALESAGVIALGHIAVTGSPARVLTRVARARGARVVVLDHAGPRASGALAAELRRRLYGSGIVVIAGERGGRGAVPS